MKGRGFAAFGNFEAKVSLGINSAKGSNEGITTISFDEKDCSKRIVKFDVPPGEVGGVMWGNRTIKAVDKVQYLDVDNLLFLELKFSKHKGTTEFSKYENGIEGKLQQLDHTSDLSAFPNIKPKTIVKEIGIFSGKWTEFILFEDNMVFDYTKQYPYQPEKYPCPL